MKLLPPFLGQAHLSLPSQKRLREDLRRFRRLSSSESGPDSPVQLGMGARALQMMLTQMRPGYDSGVEVGDRLGGALEVKANRITMPEVAGVLDPAKVL